MSTTTRTTTVDWEIPGIVSVGLHVITGTFKSGKSRLACGLAGAVATGNPFTLSDPQPVYYLASVPDARSAATYLCRRDSTIDVTFGFLPPRESSRAATIAAIKQLARPEPPAMVVIDGAHLHDTDIARLKHAAHRYRAAVVTTYNLSTRSRFNAEAATPFVVAAADIRLHITRHGNAGFIDHAVTNGDQS